MTTPRGRAVGLLLLMLAAACTADQETGGSGARTYEVRGLVRALPDPSRPDPQLTIRHEAIPDFLDLAGKISPMESMTMQFAPADGLDLAGIEPGDRVVFRLEVDWDRSPPARITRIRELPADTRLQFD